MRNLASMMRRAAAGVTPATALGLVLATVGATKAWLTAQAAGTAMLIGCGSKDFAVILGGPAWHPAHCWGCYVAAAGAALVIGAVAMRDRAR
ncbi:MAG: hypothetical protein AAFR94_01670 [Pseudomonadota bacterium]